MKVLTVVGSPLESPHIARRIFHMFLLDGKDGGSEKGFIKEADHFHMTGAMGIEKSLVDVG